MDVKVEKNRRYMKRRKAVKLSNQLRNKTAGFTLVELIVVLVILAILAAFTIPAMLGFVEDAKSKASITLTREIYAAAQSAATEIFTKYDSKDLSGTNSNVTALKQDIGKKIQILTEKDIGFKTVIDGQTNNPSEQNAPFIEVALRYDESQGNDPFYNSSKFTYKNSAKVWFKRDNSTGTFVVKAVWYVDKSGDYRTIILEDSKKGISTTVEKIK